MNRKIIYFIIFALIIGISVWSCNTNKHIDFSTIKADDTIKVVLKDTISIELVSNPSTGYKWKYTENESEKNIVFLENNYTAPEGNKIGAAGKQVFTFLAKKKGMTVIELKYARGNGEPAETHTVIVDVVKSLD
ncbi:MAG: protease inhibitor I42 family protein [Bacteroidales bacterium]|nr:protease inhibitor I42 family protein [Bacteroidales bacterium]